MFQKVFVVFFLLFFVSSIAQKDVFVISRNGSVAELKELMEKEPNCINEPNENGYTPLILACYRRNNEVAEFLVDKVKDIDTLSDMGTALMACVVNGNVQLAKLLLEKGCNPDLTDANGTTALIYATQFKNPELIKALLKHNADKSKIDSNGKTAFEYAVFSGNEDIINLLK
jgi:ankyrin repeat protein